MVTGTPECVCTKDLIRGTNDSVTSCGPEAQTLPVRQNPREMDKKSIQALRVKRHKEAAKHRRDQETEELNHLAELLPFPRETIENLDKGTVLRLTINYLMMKEYTQQGGQRLLDSCTMSNKHTNGHKGPGVHQIQNESDIILDLMDGFIIFVGVNGCIRYVSKQVEDHLHLPQVELVGRSVLDFLHPHDYSEFLKQLNPRSDSSCSHRALPPGGEQGNVEAPEVNQVISVADAEHLVRERLFYVRMKCHIKKNGCKTKQTGYSLVQWSGRLKLHENKAKDPGNLKLAGIVAICRLMQTSPLIEIRLDGNMFISRHDLDMKFTFCDPRIVTLIGYEPGEVIGKTAYQFHNPNDAQKIHNCHSNLIVKGTSVSKYYRFLGKTGQWVWMQTRATIIYTANNQPQYVVCMNYVIGEHEGKRYLQMEQEELGIPANSQPEPAGYTEQTCAMLPEENDHSSYCAPYVPSPNCVSEAGSPNNDSGCEMSPFEDENPTLNGHSVKNAEIFITSCVSVGNTNQPLESSIATLSEPLDGGMLHTQTVGLDNVTSGDQLFDLMATTMDPTVLEVPVSQSTSMVVDMTNDFSPSQNPPNGDSDLFMTDVEMTDVGMDANSIINMNPVDRPQSPDTLQKRLKSQAEIGNGILRALLNEEKDDILLNAITFKRARAEDIKIKSTCQNGVANLSDGQVNGQISLTGGASDQSALQLAKLLSDQRAAQLMTRLGVSQQDLPACLTTVAQQVQIESPASTPARSPVPHNNNTQQSLLHQLVSTPREQRSAILQITKSLATTTQTPAQQHPVSHSLSHHKDVNRLYIQGQNVAQRDKQTFMRDKPHAGSSCLEQMLLSNMTFSPNQGSDAIMEMERTRERVANIELQPDSPLLKQLLVGTIDRSKLAAGAHSQEVLHRYTPRSPSCTSTVASLLTRTQTTASAAPTIVPRAVPEPVPTIDSLATLSDLPTQEEVGAFLSGLTPEAESMMFNEVDNLLQGSEVDALLAEEARQTQLWHNHFLEDIGL